MTAQYYFYETADGTIYKRQATNAGNSEVHAIPELTGSTAIYAASAPYQASFAPQIKDLQTALAGSEGAIYLPEADYSAANDDASGGEVTFGEQAGAFFSIIGEGANAATTTSDTQVLGASANVEVDTGADVTAGDWVKITFSVDADTSADYTLRFRSDGGASDWTDALFTAGDGVDNYTAYFAFANAGNLMLRHETGASGSGSVTISNISVKPIRAPMLADSLAERGYFAREPVSGVRNLVTSDPADWTLLSGATRAVGQNGFSLITCDGGASQRTHSEYLAVTQNAFSTGSILIDAAQSSDGTYFNAYLGEAGSVRRFVPVTISGSTLSLGAAVDGSDITGGPDIAVEDLGSGLYRVGVCCAPDLSGRNHVVGIWSLTGQSGTIAIKDGQLETGTTPTTFQTRVSQYNVTQADEFHITHVAYDGASTNYTIATPTITGDATIGLAYRVSASETNAGAVLSNPSGQTAKHLGRFDQGDTSTTLHTDAPATFTVDGVDYSGDRDGLFDLAAGAFVLAKATGVDPADYHTTVQFLQNAGTRINADFIGAYILPDADAATHDTLITNALLGRYGG